MKRIGMEQVTVHYGRKRINQALRDVSWELEGPALVGLLGRNGSGKTTLMRAIAGVIVPTDGEALLDGENPVEQVALARRLVYEEPNLARTDALTLSEIFGYYAEMYPDFDRTFAGGILEIFRIPEDRRYGDLSQGMRSLFNFACALATRAEVTLLDEPVSGMDVTVRRKVYDIILRDYIEHPRFVMISSHMASEMEKIFSHILLLHEGELAFFGEADLAGEQAFWAEGPETALSEFIRGRTVLHRETGVTGSRAVLEAPVTGETEAEAGRLGLTLSRIGAADYCFYKIEGGTGKELDHLWEK